MTAKNTNVHVDEGINQINPGAGHVTQINHIYHSPEPTPASVEPTVVLGQKVDVAIGMPSPDTYAKELYKFLQTPLGRTLDSCLRDRLPGMTFSYDKLYEDALNCLYDDPESKLSTVCRSVSLILQYEALSDRRYALGQGILTLFKNLLQVVSSARMSVSTEHFLQDMLRQPVDDNSILSSESTGLSSTFKNALRCLMRMSICESANPVLRPVYDDILCADERLGRYMVGFRTPHETGIKNSLYVSWMLWAFLTKRQQDIIGRVDNGAQMPRIYESLSDASCRVVNLNYTTFASRFAPNCKVRNLWGDLAHYTDVRNKNVFALKPEYLCHINRFICQHLAGEISFVGGREAYPMPMFNSPMEQVADIPLTQLYNLTEAARDIGGTPLLILVGCDFASANNLFRDMLQANKSGQVVLVDSNIKSLASRVSEIYPINLKKYTQQLYNGRVRRVYDNRFTLVECPPGGFDVTEYLNPSAG